MADEETPVVIDPVEEALASQVDAWESDIEVLGEAIAAAEAQLARQRASKKERADKVASIKAHLDKNYEGWDIRRAEYLQTNVTKKGR